MSRSLSEINERADIEEVKRKLKGWGSFLLIVGGLSFGIKEAMPFIKHQDEIDRNNRIEMACDSSCRTSDSTARSIPKGFSNNNALESFTLYNGMDKEGGIYINGQRFLNPDTVRFNDVYYGRTNLYVVDGATKDTLNLRYVGCDPI